MDSLKERLDAIFQPRSVAVLGVSSNIDNPGTLLLRSLVGIGFEGPLYPVNPKYEEILGLKCYPSVKEIPEPPDLVILSIPPSIVPAAVRECAEAGVRGCVINTAGFSELGSDEGFALENELRNAIRSSDMRVVGPNCMGIYSSRGRLATFYGQKPSDGKTACISQSGSIVNFLYILGLERGILFSKMVSSGNELDLNCADFLEYFADDPDVNIIFSYLEQVREPRRFLKLALELKGEKPLLVCKGGLTESGKRAASSHTGAIAEDEAIWEAVVRQAGIVPVCDLADAVEMLCTFSFIGRPPGGRICVISPPGGVAVITADLVVKYGLRMADFSPKTSRRLREILPREGTATGNPVDMGFGAVIPDNLYRVIIAVAEDDGVDLILIVGGAPASRDGDVGLMNMQAGEIQRARAEIGKPVAVIGIPSGLAFSFVSELSWKRIPCYLSPSSACSAISRLIHYYNG